MHLDSASYPSDKKEKWALEHSTAVWPAQHQQSLPCVLIKFRSVTSDDLTELLEDPGSLPLTPDWF